MASDTDVLHDYLAHQDEALVANVEAAHEAAVQAKSLLYAASIQASDDLALLGMAKQAEGLVDQLFALRFGQDRARQALRA